MDDFQQYNQALQASQQDLRDFRGQAQGIVESTRQQIEQTLGETFGTEIIRETLSKAASSVKNLALKKLGFSDDEIDTISEQGFKKGLTNIAKSRLNAKFSDSLDDDAIKSALQRRGINPDTLDNLKDASKYKDMFKEQFPESELTDTEIEGKRISALRKLTKEGKDIQQEQPSEPADAPDAPAAPDVPEAPTAAPDAPASDVPAPDVPAPDLPFSGGAPPGGVLQPGAGELGARDLTQQAAEEQAQRTAQLSQEGTQRQFTQSTEEVDPEDLQASQTTQDIAEQSTDELEGQAARTAAQTTQDVEGQAARTVETTVGEEAGEEAGEGIGESLLAGLGTASEFLGPVGVVAGIGVLIASIFTHRKEHKSAAPVPINETNPSAQFGLHP